MKQAGVSKAFIIIVILIVAGASLTFYGRDKAQNQFVSYQDALKACGLKSSFTDEELRAAQKCACDREDAVSCNFIKAYRLSQQQ